MWPSVPGRADTGCLSRLVGWLVSWCIEPSQTPRIISGLRETFVKRCVVKRTDKAEVRPEEQSEKAESCLENLWNEIQLKGPERQKQKQERNKKKRSGQARLVYGKDNDINCSMPTT